MESILFNHPEVTLIHDGECRFCSACLAWVEQKLQVTPLIFQEANLDEYGLVRSQCEQSVYVLTKTEKYSGAAAVAYLLKLRGNRVLAWAIDSSGPVGQAGYRWIASHRNSLMIRIVTRYLEWVTR